MRDGIFKISFDLGKTLIFSIAHSESSSIFPLPMQDDDMEAAWLAQAAEDAADRERRAEPPPAIGRDEFLAWRAPREVNENPTRLDNPLWHWLVRTRHSAYGANEAFKGPSPFEHGPDVVL